MSEVVARIDGAIPIHGKVTVAAAAARVQLTAADIKLSSGVQVRARTSNAGLIYVGSVTVSAANGYDLSPGESVFIETRNLNLVYVDAATNGDIVSYIAT